MRIPVALVMGDIVRSRTTQRAFPGDTADLKYTHEVKAPCCKIVDRLLHFHQGRRHDFTGDQFAAFFSYPSQSIDDALYACRFAKELRCKLLDIPIVLPQKSGFFRLQLHLAIGVGEMEKAAYDEPGKCAVSAFSDLARVLAVTGPDQILLTEQCWRKAKLRGNEVHRWTGVVLPKENERVTLYELLWDGRAPRQPKSVASGI